MALAPYQRGPPSLTTPIAAMWGSDSAYDDTIGTIDHEKALREAFPGATYRHNKTPWRVVGWHSTPYERSILLKRIQIGADTRPMMTTRVSVSHSQDAIIDQRLRGSDTGSIAELSMRVVEAVEGYTIGGASFPYQTLRDTDRAMQRKAREFSTTGVLLRIDEPWFNGNGEAPRAARRAVGDALITMLARDRCIARSELRVAHTQIDLLSAAGSVRIEDAVAIFDGVAGGLRLSAPLFEDISLYLDRFSKAVELAGPDALLGRTLVDQMIGWEADLKLLAAGQLSPVQVDTEERVVFAPGSEVAIRVRGESHQRRLIEPQLMWIDDNEHFGYRYETAPGVAAWTPHDKVDCVGGDWRHMIWNARSGALREIEA